MRRRRHNATTTFSDTAYLYSIALHSLTTPPCLFLGLCGLWPQQPTVGLWCDDAADDDYDDDEEEEEEDDDDDDDDDDYENDDRQVETVAEVITRQNKHANTQKQLKKS